MDTARRSEQFHVGNERSTTIVSSRELATEARHGADYAKALVEHVSSMRATGYDNEIPVDGELWTVQVKRKASTN